MLEFLLPLSPYFTKPNSKMIVLLRDMPPKSEKRLPLGMFHYQTPPTIISTHNHALNLIFPEDGIPFHKPMKLLIAFIGIGHWSACIWWQNPCRLSGFGVRVD